MTKTRDLADLGGGFIQAGTGATQRTVEDKLKDVVSVKDFGAVGDGTTDDTSAIQAAIDSSTGPLQVLLPSGTYKTTTTIYLRRSGVRIVGCGPSVSSIKYVNAFGGIAFSGDTNTFNSTSTYESCALENFEIASSGASTDPSTVVDLTSFSYSHFDIEIQNQRVNGVIYYGQGNAGTSPYFNHIESTSLFGGSDYTQTAFQFRAGAWTGGSAGPNANVIGPITRAASFSTLVDLRTGQGNLFSNISGESIGGTYFILGGTSAASTGTSTGSNAENTLIDTGQSWVTNEYINGAVQITSGTGSGQTRIIKTHTNTTLTLQEPWADIPDATSQYAIFPLTASKNKFVNLRGEGLYSQNPDFIYAFPGADGNEFAHMSVESLGTGKRLFDNTGSVRNSFYGPNKVLFTHTFNTPGASANVNAFPRISVWGGLPIPGNYVIEWMRVNIDYFNHGDSATITLDAGGAVTGAGNQTYVLTIPDGQSTAVVMPHAAQKQDLEGANNSLHLNLQTGAAFAGTSNVIVTVCLTLVPS